MKTTLYMAVSADGFIARPDDSTPWSDEEWEAFLGEVRSIGNMIIGRRTYEKILSDSGNFRDYGEAVVVVVSDEAKKDDSSVTFVSSHEEAIRFLQKKGFSETLVAGGATLNASFLGANLIDAIVLDVEPKLFGSGLRLFTGEISERDLKLDDIRKLSAQSVQLRYSVVKPS